MRRTLTQDLTLFALVGVLGLFLQSSAKAQFLDKLEAAVRAQLEKAQQSSEASAKGNSNPASGKQSGANPAPPSESTEELPPPASQPPRRTVPANPRPLTPGDEIPSILEMAPSTPFLVPNPVPNPLNSDNRAGTADRTAPRAALPLDTGEPLDRIYLGLEAEDPVGGGIGVRVTSVTKDSPAWKGGFEVGDRILAVNGFAIADLDSMVEQLSKAIPGESVRFLTKRGGRNLNLVAVLQNSATAAQIDENAIVNTGPGWLGVVVNDLSGAFRQQFGIGIFRGAAVTSVAPDSPAALAGIKAGHAISEVDGIKIESAAQMMAMVGTARPGDVLQLKVAQGGFVKPMAITLAAQPSETPRGRSANRVNATRSGPQNPLAEDQIARQQAAADTAARETALRQEIARLQAELDAANARIADTEQRLNGILESLNRNR